MDNFIYFSKKIEINKSINNFVKTNNSINQVSFYRYFNASSLILVFFFVPYYFIQQFYEINLYVDFFSVFLLLSFFLTSLYFLGSFLFKNSNNLNASYISDFDYKKKDEFFYNIFFIKNKFNFYLFVFFSFFISFIIVLLYISIIAYINYSFDIVFNNIKDVRFFEIFNFYLKNIVDLKNSLRIEFFILFYGFLYLAILKIGVIKKSNLFLEQGNTKIKNIYFKTYKIGVENKNFKESIDIEILKIQENEKILL